MRRGSPIGRNALRCEHCLATAAQLRHCAEEIACDIGSERLVDQTTPKHSLLDLGLWLSRAYGFDKKYPRGPADEGVADDFHRSGVFRVADVLNQHSVFAGTASVN